MQALTIQPKAGATNLFSVRADYTKKLYSFSAGDSVSAAKSPIGFIFAYPFLSYFIAPPNDPLASTYTAPPASYAFNAQGSGGADAFLGILTEFQDLSYDPSSPTATYPYLYPPSATDDGASITVTNQDTGESATFAGNPPLQYYGYASGANVTHGSFRELVALSNGSGSGAIGNVWKFDGITQTYVHTQEPGGAAPGIVRFFYYTPRPRQITITNPTATHLSSNSNTLDFGISTVNTTLHSWSVDLQQNNTTIKTFQPSTDPRGPGVAEGTNPYNVTLNWDGLDQNNRPVTGNVTWVMTANTTNYVSGGPVNDGIDSAQAKVDGNIPSSIFEMKKLSASSITLVDVHNEVIKRPQYDADLRRKEAIALPIRDAFPFITADIKATVPPDSEPIAYYIWGESADSKKIFGPAQLVPVPGINRVNLSVHINKIVKYPSITWYYVPKEGGEVGRIGTTDSPIYVTLDTPQPPQTQPRVDVVDFAVATQKNNNSLNELQIAAYLTTRIYKDSGFVYDEDSRPHHTETLDAETGGRMMNFTVSNFLDFPGNVELEPEGNCQDFSNLFQVCGAALGARSLEVRRVDGRFHFRRVWPVGFSDWFNPDDWVLVFHQTGWSTETQTVFDPTYQLDNGGNPLLPISMRPPDFRLLLQDRTKKPDRWSEQSPVRPLSVR